MVSSVLYALAAAGLSNLLGQANSSADLEKLVGDVKPLVGIPESLIKWEILRVCFAPFLVLRGSSSIKSHLCKYTLVFI